MNNELDVENDIRPLQVYIPPHHAQLGFSKLYIYIYIYIYIEAMGPGEEGGFSFSNT